MESNSNKFFEKFLKKIVEIDHQFKNEVEFQMDFSSKMKNLEKEKSDLYKSAEEYLKK